MSWSKTGAKKKREMLKQSKIIREIPSLLKINKLLMLLVIIQ